MTVVAPLNPPQDRILAGVALSLGAILLLSVMDVAVKWLSAGYDTVELVFWRGLFGLIPIVVFVAVSGGIPTLRTNKPLIHAGRGLLHLGAVFCFFYAFSVMPLADAYAIAFSAPLFITALSVPMLGERVGRHRWTAVGIGFVGVLIVLRPWEGLGNDGLDPLGAAAALVGALFFALIAISIRWLGRTDSSQATITYSNLVVVIVSGALMWTQPTLPAVSDLIVFVSAGLLGGAGIICMTYAFRLAPPSLLSPFEYTAIVWGLLFGVLLFGDWPDRWMLTGCAVVVLAGLYIVYRETRATRAGPEVS